MSKTLYYMLKLNVLYLLLKTGNSQKQTERKWYRSPLDARRTKSWSVSGTSFCTNTFSASWSPNGPGSAAGCSRALACAGSTPTAPGAVAVAGVGLAASRVSTLNEARGALPGCVLIMPRKRVTTHVRTWLYSAHTVTGIHILQGDTKLRARGCSNNR